MASIAYVTDQQMIEFHRLNGNREINFWRPTSSGKRFADFHEGDLLFFLSKGTERGKKREKGLIGYGVFHKTTQMKFEQMWKKYKTLNGYATKKELYEAIVKVSKNKQMPDTLNCIELKDIVFFQYPLYLSEIGIEISNKLESYFYLDRDHTNITAQLLKEAQQIGIDAWSTMFQKEDENRFQYDAYVSVISTILEKIEEIDYTKTEEKEAVQLLKKVQNQNTKQYRMISTTCMIALQDNLIRFYHPLLSIQMKQLKQLIGHIQMMQYEINRKFPKLELQFYILNKKPIKKELRLFLAAQNIHIIEDIK